MDAQKGGNANVTENGLLSRSNDSTHAQFVRYLFVGGVAFVVDYCSMVFLASVLLVHYLAAASIGFCLGLATNYLISVRWVFGNRSLSNKYAEFVVFAVIGLIGLALNDGVIFAGHEYLGIDYRISKLFATGVTLVFNFAARKLILFRQ